MQSPHAPNMGYLFSEHDTRANGLVWSYVANPYIKAIYQDMSDEWGMVMNGDEWGSTFTHSSLAGMNIG